MTFLGPCQGIAYMQQFLCCCFVRRSISIKTIISFADIMLVTVPKAQGVIFVIATWSILYFHIKEVRQRRGCHQQHSCVADCFTRNSLI